MPVHKVKLPDGSTGYQWGRTGKIYKDPRKAYAQGAAIEHSGWKQKKAVLRQPKSVQDLDRMYDKITYGLVDFQAGKPWRKTHRSTTQQDWDDNWKLLTPQQIRQYKAAICWDAARFNHHVLDKLGIQHRSLFAHSQRDANAQYNYDPTHSFTVYKGADNKWHWLQGSWQPYRHNNAVADTADQLIQHVGQLLTEASEQPQYIGQITQWPQYGTGMTAFYKYMLDQVRRNKLLQTAMQEQGTQKKAALDRQQLQQIARPYYTDDKWQHIQDVYRDAQVLKGKELTPTQAASIIFHDMAKRDMGTSGHAANGAAIAQRQLKQHFPAEQLALICQAIKQHNPAQRIDLDTMKSRIKQFSSPEAQLLAISDDLFPDPSIIQDRALSYMKRRNIQNTPQNLAATVRKVYYPGTRMPQLKHYKRQFQLANLPLQAYIDSVYK